MEHKIEKQRFSILYYINKNYNSFIPFISTDKSHEVNSNS